MTRIHDIGLFVAGYKGGFRVFYSNSVVERKSMERILSYDREFLKLIKPFQTLYSLEITGAYKVFTIYRSCTDNGNGAYVSIAILIPHKTRILYVRNLLEGLMDAYFKEYIHPIFGTYVQCKYDDIGFLEHCIVEHEHLIVFEKPSEFSPSMCSNQYGCIAYDYIEEVDQCFENPYKKVFFPYQKIYIVSRQLLGEIIDMNKDFLSRTCILEM